MTQQIAEHFKAQPVLKAWSFGSFAHDEEIEYNNVDILFEPDHFSGKLFTLLIHGGLYMDFKKLLGREVDLVVNGTLWSYAVESANRDKKLILGRFGELVFTPMISI